MRRRTWRRRCGGHRHKRSASARPVRDAGPSTGVCPRFQTFRADRYPPAERRAIRATVYQLDDQTTAKKFAGKMVKVSGTVDANRTIHVTDITPVGADPGA